jgi:hypothetical protein
MKGRPVRGGGGAPILQLLTWPFGVLAAKASGTAGDVAPQPSLAPWHVIYLWFLARRVARFRWADGGFVASVKKAAVPGRDRRRAVTCRPAAGPASGSLPIVLPVLAPIAVAQELLIDRILCVWRARFPAPGIYSASAV